jgi:hypothetical protein
MRCWIMLLSKDGRAPIPGLGATQMRDASGPSVDLGSDI